MHVRTVSCHKNAHILYTLFLAERWEERYARYGYMRSLPIKVVAEADLGIFLSVLVVWKY